MKIQCFGIGEACSGAGLLPLARLLMIFTQAIRQRQTISRYEYTGVRKGILNDNIILNPQASFCILSQAEEAYVWFGFNRTTLV